MSDKTIFDLIDKQFRELPIHKRFEKLEKLVSDDVHDALTDLTEEEINITAIYLALNEYYDNNLKTLEFLIKKKLSLMRSRERLGRQEYLKGLREGKEEGQIQYVVIPHEKDETGVISIKKEGVIAKISKFFKRKRGVDYR